MNEIAVWLTSIAAVVILSVLVDVILPEGSIRKFINGIMAVIVMLVIIAPVPNFLNTKINFSPQNSVVSAPDTEYITNVYKSKIRLLEKNVDGELENCGYSGTKTTVAVDRYDAEMRILNVTVDITGLIINKNLAHINKYDGIKDKVSAFLKIDEGIIGFYG